MNSYDLWKTDNSDYYDNLRAECKDCSNKEDKLIEASDWLKKIVKQLYTKESLDVNHFERCLDELCYLLDVTINTGDIQIARPAARNTRDLTIDYVAFCQFTNQQTKVAL